MPNLFANNQSSTAVEEEAVEIVINEDEEIVADRPDADINELIPQPPGGRYLLKASLAEVAEDKENPYTSATKKNHKPFVAVVLNLEIVDESSDFHGFAFTKNINSLVQKQRQTSDVHNFMACIGEVLPQRISIRELKQRVKEALESNPSVWAEIEWKASIKTGSGTYDWTEIKTLYNQFPKDPEGDGRLQEVSWTDPKTKEVHVLRAKAYVSKFLRQ